METVKITIAGEELEVLELPLKKNRAWRDKARVPLSKQRAIVQRAEKIEQEGEVPDLYNEYIDLLEDQIDILTDLVFEYLELDPEREGRMREKVTESEVQRGFIMLSRLCFSTNFFWDLTGAALTSGSLGSQIGKSSLGASGESESIPLTG